MSWSSPALPARPPTRAHFLVLANIPLPLPTSRRLRLHGGTSHRPIRTWQPTPRSRNGTRARPSSTSPNASSHADHGATHRHQLAGLSPPSFLVPGHSLEFAQPPHSLMGACGFPPPFSCPCFGPSGFNHRATPRRSRLSSLPPRLVWRHFPTSIVPVSLALAPLGPVTPSDAS